MNISPNEPVYTSNPRANYLAYKADIDAAIGAVLEQPVYNLGPVVAGFEAEFAAFMGMAHAVGVNSGTDALHLTLRGLGIGAGDEVITVSQTSIATVAAIEMSGAAPVLVDVEPHWHTIDPDAAASAIGPRTRAIIAVHLYGQVADVIRLRDLCDKHNLALIEDCAQSHGASWNGRPAGSFGDAACFSFYPTKNLGTIGDGGMAVTDDRELAGRIAMLRQYGWTQPQYSLTPGWNSRLGPLQAAILSVKLKHLPDMIKRRRQIAAHYAEGLGELPVGLPCDRGESQHAYHLYVAQCEDASARRNLLAHLARKNILASVHYPVPVHAQPAYAGRIAVRTMQITESLPERIISLPLYPELAEPQLDFIIATVRDYFRGQR
jgi:dTDP-4-amino-4,6-dideoxygalactose transaminase